MTKAPLLMGFLRLKRRKWENVSSSTTRRRCKQHSAHRNLWGFSDEVKPRIRNYQIPPEPSTKYIRYPSQPQERLHHIRSASLSSLERIRPPAKSRLRTGAKLRDDDDFHPEKEKIDALYKGMTIANEVIKRLSFPKAELHKLQEQNRVAEQELRFERAKEPETRDP